MMQQCWGSAQTLWLLPEESRAAAALPPPRSPPKSHCGPPHCCLRIPGHMTCFNMTAGHVTCFNMTAGHMTLTFSSVLSGLLFVAAHTPLTLREKAFIITSSSSASSPSSLPPPHLVSVVGEFTEACPQL